ncbi:MAG: D-glycero-beta-D-manno-heptose 1-phosphate adenylyltransferase [Planctomycetes bacterium]|nr:D-glycero-beta-D-manno-heptose 1-phosphate adenylyltransferase [Planctomycetota bacterium]
MKNKLKALVVGDLMLDIYIAGSSERISPEAPVPVVVKEREDFLLGGAGNVAANLASLGIQTYITGIIGKDQNGIILKDIFNKTGINSDFLFEVEAIPTPTKTRFVSRTQQLLRLDQEKIAPLSKLLSINKVVSRLKTIAKEVDFVVFADYAKGFLDEILCRRLIQCAKFSSAGLKGTDYRKYNGVNLVSLNRSESMKLTNAPNFKLAGRKLKKDLKSHYVSVTLGKDGMFLISDDNEITAPARARSVYDVTGAGDTVLAVLSYALHTGHSIEQAALLANEAAAIVIEQFGTATVTLEEIQKSVEGTNKIIEPSQFEETIQRLKRARKKIVFTNGCFDILHAGHIDLLRFAKSKGDILIVGVNTDSSIRQNKGDHRPVVPLEQRIYVLSALSMVDHVVVFNEQTPINLIKKIKPNVLVKGEDWSGKIVGQDFVEGYGGSIEIFKFKRKISSSSIIEKSKHQSKETR